MNNILKNLGSFKLLKIRDALIQPIQQFFPFLFLLLINSCISEFIPQITEDKELLVVEGLITDQPETNTIKLSKSLPLGKKSDARPLSGCIVRITDNLGNIYGLKETIPGTYITDFRTFIGEIGKLYTLQISTNTGNNNLNYKSYPIEMKPVPSVDSLYYEKTVIQEKSLNNPGIDGCQIYLDTHDPGNNCKFFRWDYSETWTIRLLFPVPNMKCWITEQSKTILIKSTVSIGEALITRYPINYISNATDRLKAKYSILVNQYSLNEDEYIFWEKLQNLTEQVGGLYDVIPSSISSNLRCIEYPDEKVLGYFSVSAKSSKRIFIKDNFAGIIDPYADCISDTIYDGNIPGLGTDVWILLIHPGSFTSQGYIVITKNKGCSDCTTRGSNVEPAFWQEDK